MKFCEQWCTRQLAKVGAPPCENLARHFTDGVALASLLSALTGNTIKVNKAPKMTAHKMDNIDLCLKVCSELPKFKLQATPLAIHNGDLSIITPFIMKLTRYFEESSATEEPPHVSALWQKAQAVRPGNEAYALMRAQLDADLAAIEEAYRRDQEAAAAAAAMPVTKSLVGLRSSTVSDDQLALAEATVYTSTRGLQAGATKYLTAARQLEPSPRHYTSLSRDDEI